MMIEKMKISSFWKTTNFAKNEHVLVKNLGSYYQDQEFRAIVKGIYTCDADGNPNCYILQMIDKIPNHLDINDYQSSFDYLVMTRACVFGQRDLTLKDETVLEYKE